MNRKNLSVEDPSPVNILVVDDHPNMANTLARALSQLGPRVAVRSATSGQEAIEFANENATDILITDMVMPGMTGLELIEKLQTHPAGRPAFSFLITAYDVPGLKVSARRLKVKDVIIKPVRPERICQIVTEAMDEMEQTKPQTPSTSPNNLFKILIADDQPDNLLLLSRYLESEGYAYIKAKDGQETLDKVRSELPDLVLLDVNMPIKDGFAVLSEIRADPATEHIPVIILTAARLDPTDVQSGLNLGADDYITKPFDRRELFARVRTKLRVKEAEDGLRRRNRELNLLPEIGRQLSGRLNLDELLNLVLHRTVETLGAEVGHLLLLDSKNPIHKEYRLSSESPDVMRNLPPLNALVEHIRTDQQSILITDTSKDERWQSNHAKQAYSAVMVPMIGRLDLLGVLVLVHEQADYFNKEHLFLLQAIASQAAMATENARLYASVAQEQEKLSAILQGAADAIMVFDADGCLSMLNPAAGKLFTDYETRLGVPLARGRGYDKLIEALEKGTSEQSHTEEIAWADGRTFTAMFTPMHNGGWVVVLHDVTRFKRLERVKDEFIATASHDLRNPITSIKGFTKLMPMAGSLNEQQVEFVQRIDHAAGTMTELVENMLDLAKMDLNAKPVFEPVDASALLSKIANEFKPQAEAKGQRLTLEEAGSTSMVSGDAFQLSQALRNLVGNAIKYTPEGGAVNLSARHEAGKVFIRVADTGYGIPATDLEHVFDRFYRVRNNGHDEIEGNGLGLAIVKSIAERHGGDVAVESEVGKGSCFCIFIPLMEL